MNLDALIRVLPIIGNGILGIFIVLIVILLFIKLLNAVFKDKKEGQ